MLDKEEIGKRLAFFRKEKGITQRELADNLHISYQAVSKWELGKALPTVEVKNGTYKNRLTGLLYCADCGAKLTYRSPNATHRPDGKTYDSEQGELEGRIEEIRNSIAEYEKNTVHTDKFMEVVGKYQDCEEITTPMLNEFIEKIVVHEADKSGGR